MSLEPRSKFAVYAAGAIILAALPFIIRSNYWVGTVNLAIIYSIAVLGLNILLGMTGQLNLAQAAFWGIGAYAAALLNTRLGWPFWATLIAAPLIAAAFGVLLGLPTLRLAGRYLALATLGFGIVISLVAENWRDFTGGVDGIPGIAPPSLAGVRFATNDRFYYVALVCLIVAVLVQVKIKHSRMGRAFHAIKENELAAELSGVDVFKYRVIAFALCSAYAGLAGQLFAHGTKYVSADTFFADVSILFVCMLMIGGVGSIAGPIIGASLLTLIPEWLRFLQGPWAMAVFGLAIIFIVRFMPEGLVSLFRRARSSSSGGHKAPDSPTASNAAAMATPAGAAKGAE